MGKQINLASFRITTLPSGDKWPIGMIRDSFRTQNERRGMREDRTSAAPIQLVASANSGEYTSLVYPLATATAVPVDRLLVEATVPALSADQLAAGNTLTVYLEGSDGGGFETLGSFVVYGSADGVAEQDVSYQPSLGSTVTQVRVRVVRSDTDTESIPVTLRVYFVGDQVRQKRWLTCHMVCTTKSTISAEYQTFIAQDKVTSPVVYRGEPDYSGDRGTPYAGDWNVNCTESEDQQDASSVVRICMEQTGEWRDL